MGDHSLPGLILDEGFRMALKITLRPGEKMIIGGAVVTNGGAKCDLFIENEVPMLRGKNIMTQEDADSPCRRIYFAVQLMYIDTKNLTLYHDQYWRLVRELMDAAPSLVGIIDAISEEIVSNRYYQALKLARKLILYEEEALFNVRKSNAGV